MGLFGVIWWLTIFLALHSCLLMVVLILRRLVLRILAARQRRQEEDLLVRLTEYLASETPDSSPRIARNRSEALLLLEIVEHLLRSIGGNGRRRLLAVLRAFGGEAEQMRRLRRGKEWQRVAAARRLRHFDAPEVVDALRLALDDASSEVRAAAARSLLSLDAVDSVTVLFDKLVVRAPVAPKALRDIFRRLGGRFRDEMLAVLEDEAERVRIVAIDALGHSGDLRVVEPLMKLLPGGGKEIAANVLRALALLGDPRALPAVREGLDSPAWEVRCQAAFCAGRVGAIEVKDRLAELLDDPVWWVRYRAAEALYEFGGEGIPLLLSLALEPTRAGETAQMIVAERLGQL